jgi:hypothetical protein
MKSFTLWQMAGLFLPFLLIFSKSQSQIVSINAGNWNTPSTWSTNSLPGPGDDVIIRHAVTVSNSAFSATVRSLTLENGTNNATATLSFNSGTAVRSLHILNDLVVSATTNNNCRFQLQGSSTTATVDGNIILHRDHTGFVDAFGISLRSGSSMTANNLSITYANSADDNQEVFIRENSSMVLSGTINVLSTGGAEEPSIDVVDNAFLECRDFNMELALPESPSGVGRDAELRVWNNGRVVVHGNFIATRRGGRRIMITIGNSAPAQASLLVEGNMVLEHFDGLNHTNKDFPVTVVDQSSLTVRGNLAAHSTSARPLNFSFSGSSQLDVDGTVTLTGSTATNLTINAFNTSGLFFGGDIIMNFPISPNPNIFFFSATSPNISTVTFDGTANQAVPGSETYGNLIINNPLHVTLAGNITVNNQLNMMNGKVIAATRVVTLPLGATIGGSSSAYICNGKLSRGLAAGAGPYWFYVGDTAKGYSPVTLSNLSSTTTFEVTYFPEDASAASAPGPYPVATKVAMLEKVSNLEYWMIDRVAGTGAAQVALGWNIYSGVNGNELNALRIAHWDGTRWTETGPNIYTGDATSGMIRTTLDINSFSPFTLASTTTDNFVLLDLQPKERIAPAPTVVESIHVYPNPVIGNDITIQLPGTGRQTIGVRVIDPAGRIVHVARVTTGNKYMLPLRQYATIKGTYLVQLLYSGRSLTSKVVVL